MEMGDDDDSDDDYDDSVSGLTGDPEGADVLEHAALPITFNETRLKLHQKKLRQVLQAQQQRLQEGERRRVCGKEYTTSKFLSTPSRIVFKDFVVGSTYTQKVTLTNVSFAFNSFKLRPLADEFTDFFTIDFQPPGRMSAGTTNTLTITFRPKINQDIITQLPMMAETGPFSVPLECYTRKAVISLPSPAWTWGR